LGGLLEAGSTWWRYTGKLFLVKKMDMLWRLETETNGMEMNAGARVKLGGWVVRGA
jgi:hypothetical protein